MTLVDLDRLKTEFSRVVWVHDVDADIANGLLERAKAVDAVEVMHGEWVDGLEFDHDESVYACSICNEPWVLTAGTPSENLMNYCPNCGAKMEVENDT